MVCRGATVPVRWLTKIRSVALLVVGILVLPAIVECTNWSAAAEDRHICCKRGESASQTALTDCCAMSPQSNGAAPPETQAVRPPLKLLISHFVPFIDPGVSRVAIPSESLAARPAFVVPLYIQQASLLI